MSRIGAITEGLVEITGANFREHCFDGEVK